MKASAEFPLATVTRIIKEQMPRSMQLGSDTAPYLQHCMAEYLELLTAQANEQCMAAVPANKTKSATTISTINERHAAVALEELGFTHHCTAPSSSVPGPAAVAAEIPVAASAGDAATAAGATGGAAKESSRSANGKRKRKLSKPTSGLSEAELLRIQQELFATARQKQEPTT